MSLKTFELVPVVEKVNLTGDTTKSSISCMEMFEDDLYLGTTDSFVIHFAIQQGKSPTGKTTFMNKLQRHKHLGLRRPVSQLLACSALGQLLILSDNNVYAASMHNLELRNSGINKELFKGVTVMALNIKPPVFNPEEVQVCFGTKRKTAQIYTMTNTANMLLKEISLTDPPSVLSIDGEIICTTLGNQYFIFNYVTSAIQELFMYEAHNVLPMVKRTGHEEFLLNGPTDTMGLIVTSAGVSPHQPFTWSDGLRSVAYSYPYVLVLGNTTITVHSVLDQKQKQAMSFQGGVFMAEFDNRVLIAMHSSVLSFIPIPYSKQIQMLLIDKRIDEAFDLLLVASRLDPKQYDQKFTKQIQMQAGFIYFAQADFTKALELFKESLIDPREIIVLYPLMMPKNRTFAASRPLLHSIKDLTVIVKGSKTVFAEAKKFLLKFLQTCRNKFTDANIEVDTALMKLYAECNHPKLSELLSTQNECSLEETISWLTQFKRFHSLALYYCFLNQAEKAIHIWQQILQFEIDDNNFPGIMFVVRFLTGISDERLVLNSLKWLLEINQESAVKVLTERLDEILDHDKMCEFLQKYNTAFQLFLEHLVITKGLQKERFHTQLVLLHVQNVIKCLTAKIKVDEDTTIARSKLQNILETSCQYRISTVLQKICGLPLYNEIAILYGKMDQHDKALAILVYKLRDFDAAERYCDVISVNKDNRFKQKVFHALIDIYLNPSSTEADSEVVRPEHLVLPAVNLLNSRWKEFDVMKILQVIPEDWSVDMIKPFLTGSIRLNLNSARQTAIESSITRRHYVTTNYNSLYLKMGVVNISEGVTCDFCKKPFNEPISVRYPNGVLVHAHCCRNKQLCPVTGKKFSS